MPAPLRPELFLNLCVSPVDTSDVTVNLLYVTRVQEHVRRWSFGTWPPVRDHPKKSPSAHTWCGVLTQDQASQRGRHAPPGCSVLSALVWLHLFLRGRSFLPDTTPSEVCPGNAVTNFFPPLSPHPQLLCPTSNPFSRLNVIVAIIIICPRGQQCPVFWILHP